MSEAFDDYRNLVADRDQLLEHNAELRARVAELVEACNIRTNELHRIAGLLGVEPNADAINAALAKREAVAVPEGDLIEKIVEYGDHRENEGGSYATFQKSEARRHRAEADAVLGEIRALLAKREAVAVPECFLALYRAALGLTHGEDWNNGTAASFHRIPLIDATGRCAELLAASQQAAKGEGT